MDFIVTRCEKVLLCQGLLNYTGLNTSSALALTEPPSYQDDVQAIFAEVVLTTILVLTVLTVAVETKGNNSIAPFAIGMAVAAGIFAGYVVNRIR